MLNTTSGCYHALDAILQNEEHNRAEFKRVKDDLKAHHWTLDKEALHSDDIEWDPETSIKSKKDAEKRRTIYNSGQNRGEDHQFVNERKSQEQEQWERFSQGKDTEQWELSSKSRQSNRDDPICLDEDFRGYEPTYSDRSCHYAHSMSNVRSQMRNEPFPPSNFQDSLCNEYHHLQNKYRPQYNEYSRSRKDYYLHLNKYSPPPGNYDYRRNNYDPHHN